MAAAKSCFDRNSQVFVDSIRFCESLTQDTFYSKALEAAYRLSTVTSSNLRLVEVQGFEDYIKKIAKGDNSQIYTFEVTSCDQTWK